jgi:hypothetical protein
MKKSVLLFTVVFFLFAIFIASCKKDTPINSGYSPPQPITGKTYSALEISGFKQLALYVSVGSGAEYIKKWAYKEVLVFVNDTGYSVLNSELDDIIAGINENTNGELIMKRTDNKANAHIYVYLVEP